MPFVLMIAGPNGSGKTTLTRQMRASGIDFGEYINPDDIALTLQGDYPTRVARAQIEADRMRDACLLEKRSFSFETVMSHPSKVDILNQAKALGFDVILYFVSTDSPLINLRRVAQRVALGGHDVPPERIVARYERTMAMLPAAMDASHAVFLFDNSKPQEGNLVRGTQQSSNLRLIVKTAKPENAPPGMAERIVYSPQPEWVRKALADWDEILLMARQERSA
jgi:predicted ABC-type ATPase